MFTHMRPREGHGSTTERYKVLQQRWFLNEDSLALFLFTE